MVGHGAVDGEFHVAHGIVGGVGAPGAEEPALSLVEPAAVRRNRPGSETPALIEVDCRAPAILCDAIIDLLLGLGEVDVDPDPLFSRESGAPAEAFRRDRVDRVRTDGCLDAWVSSCFYVGNEGLGRPDLGFPLLRAPEVDEPVGEGCPEPHLIDGIRCAFHEEVHVVERDCAAPDHLKAREFCPIVDIVAGEVSLKRPDLLGEPLLEWHIVGISPEKGHRGVGVGVDHARDGDPIRSIDDDIGIYCPPGILPDPGDRSRLIDSDIHSRSPDGDPGDQHRSPGGKYIVHASRSTIFVSISPVLRRFSREVSRMCS